jgi:hypothetical protein
MGLVFIRGTEGAVTITDSIHFLISKRRHSPHGQL